jgi:phospholipid/cholesterol/gamma-HCH transport system substrate-binding protein
MKPFRERNPVIIGFIGFAVIAMLLVAASRADRLPIIGAGDTYHAEFAEIGGLKSGNEVRVAGVPVGKVRDIELDGNKVKVTFKVDKGTRLGRETAAEIRIRTLLGAQFLALQPSGSGRLEKGGTIPESRTTPPYDVVQAFSDLSTTTEALDVDQISQALETLSDVAAQTPEEFRGAIRGVSDLSRNLAARDEQINTLLKNLKKVTGVINARDDQLVALVKDSSVLFDAISARREAIHRLLVSTQEISAQLTGLVKDTEADLQPALRQLRTVTTMLARNEQSLDRALTVMPGFLRVFANALGNGPWFDTYVKIGGAG